MSSTIALNEPVAPARHPVRGIGLWVLKTVALWITIIVAAALAAHISGHLPPAPPHDGPLTVMQAVFVANGGIAIVLSLLAERSRVRGAELALLLFVGFFCLSVGMMMIEALFFNDSVKMPMGQLVSWGEQGVIAAAVTGIVGALLFRPAAETPAPVPAGIFWRLVWLSLIYVFLYLFAGFFIAWQSEAVRTYYAHMNVSMGPLLALQLGRGFLWALISLFIVTRIRGSLTSRAIVMALLFAVVTAIQLLYPNALMPAPVRLAHLVEVGSSEFVYGLVAAAVLMAGGARRPLSESSPWRLIAGRA